MILFTTNAEPNEPNTCLTFAFDDSFKSPFNYVVPLLNQANFNATFYISPIRLGCLHADYLNWWDVYDLYQNGHEIGCHGLSHEKSFGLTDAALKNQFCMCRALLRRFGPPASIAYPHAQVNNATKTIAQECGYSNGRGVGLNLSDPEIINPVDIWKIRSYSVQRSDNCEDMKRKLGYAINAISHQRKWVIFNFHAICSSSGNGCNRRYEYSTLRYDFQCFFDHVRTLYTQDKLCVKNVREVLQTDPLPIPRSFDGVDLPSDFIFDPALNPNNPDSSGSGIFLPSLVLLLMYMLLNLK